MPKKFTKAQKKRIKTYEKDAKADKKLWPSIKKIHVEDENIFSSLKRFFKTKLEKRARKKAAKNRTSKRQK